MTDTIKEPLRLSSPLIGLGGRLRAGKDAVADHLVEKHGYVKLGMSDALHEAMLVLDPIVAFETAGDFYDAVPIRYSTAIERYGYVKTKLIYDEARSLLQKLGTEVGRQMFDENVWVNIIARKIDDLRGAGHPVVVTGIRFPNELRMVDELGGKSVWIERPSDGLEAAPAAAHASETSIGVKDFSKWILNAGTLEDLYATVDELADAASRGFAG